jgi:hypothetical protein
MRGSLVRMAAVSGAALLAVAGTGTAMTAAAAVPSTAVSFADAHFHGYATGSELHLSALDVSGTQVAGLDQGFSGASTNTAGLTTAIQSETTSVVQPAQSSSVKAYGTGSGFELGLGTDTLSQTDQNQIQIAGRAEQVAPPNGPAVTKQIGPVNASPIATASVLTGEGAALFDPQTCPLGQPLSYGMGDAANAQALIASGVPTLSTAGTGTSTARSTSETYLSSNGDGTFGLTTQASDVIAPISVNLPGGLAVRVAVQSAGGVDEPVTLTAKTTGEATGATIRFSSDDILKVDLITPASTTPVNVITIPLSAVGSGGLHIPLSTSSLGSTLTTLDGAASGVAATVPAIGPTLSGVLTQPAVTGLLNTVGATVSQVTNQVATIDLGSIDIDTYPHVIGGAATDPATTVGGTEASGALDLLHLDLGLSGTVAGQAIPAIPVANFYAGHLEAVSNLTAPITCSVPVIKSANPTAVTAGQSFVYNIQVPDPAKIDLIDCDLTNVDVTDTITDYQGDPTFSVTSATDTATGAAGTIQTVSPNKAIVTFTGLSYKVAATGQPPNPPIPLSIAISVPSTSTAGVITDTAIANATVANCRGGVSGTANLGVGASGVALTGAYTLNQPSVAAAAPAAANANSATPTAAPKTLPFTGAMGGLWQPVGGLGALALGGAALGLIRRSRRLGRT